MKKKKKNVCQNSQMSIVTIIFTCLGDLMGHGFDWEGGSIIITNDTVEARAAAFADFIYSAQCLVYRGPCMVCIIKIMLYGLISSDFSFYLNYFNGVIVAFRSKLYRMKNISLLSCKITLYLRARKIDWQAGFIF
jgi:hypothetical protein